MFRIRNGKRPERSRALESHELPYYMKLGVEYEVVGDPMPACIDSHDGMHVDVYMIRERDPLLEASPGHVQDKRKSMQLWYIHTSLALPKTFWIRIITGRKASHRLSKWIESGAGSKHKTTFEIVDGEDNGTPQQILRMRAPTLMFMRNGRPVTPLRKS